MLPEVIAAARECESHSDLPKPARNGDMGGGTFWFQFYPPRGDSGDSIDREYTLRMLRHVEELNFAALVITVCSIPSYHFSDSNKARSNPISIAKLFC